MAEQPDRTQSWATDRLVSTNHSNELLQLDIDHGHAGFHHIALRKQNHHCGGAFERGLAAQSDRQG